MSWRHTERATLLRRSSLGHPSVWRTTRPQLVPPLSRHVRTDTAKMRTLLGCIMMAAVVVMAQRRPAFIPGGEPDYDPNNPPYPTFSQVPPTSFTCEGRWGIFVDHEASCQVFHICRNPYKYSFLCPNATLFHANYQVCDHYYNVPCGPAN
ncbi:uncharacterized protein [Panulirus ornatus]|uniref:uncharacterized protein n=1 Tax=Panulirus ornatus TaxID=150431 RepID=UPI003A8534FE